MNSFVFIVAVLIDEGVFVMGKYFNQLVNARGQLAGTHYAIDGYLKALEEGKDHLIATYLEILKEDVVKIKEILEDGIDHTGA
jgi:hypothetical protein